MHGTDHQLAAYLHEHVVFNDRYDNLVYEAAKKIFTEEIEFIKSMYNISVTDDYFLSTMMNK